MKTQGWVPVWCGIPEWGMASSLRREAMDKVQRFYNDDLPWKECYRCGWRTVKCDVLPVIGGHNAL